ncbi:WSC domain-containing protein [Aspergillus ambiguus]|uniref:WSC domain-containing protein n=1 Tax=Aspergillus ambiguus TaxID=176160 RepID=UPI003CCD3515
MKVSLPASLFLLAVGLPAVYAQTEVKKGCYSNASPLTSAGTYTFQSDGYCQKQCLKDNYKVFALHNANECFCGNKLPAESDKTDDSDCNTSCAGWPDTMCGGKNAYSVYLTGISQNVEAVGSSSSSSTKDSSTSTTNGHSATDNGQTVKVTAASETASPEEEKKDSGPNTAAIAAGVVVGVVGFCALVGAIFFLWRFRNRKNAAADNQFRRSTNENHFGKPMSQSSMSDSRFDGDFMAQRRQSNGSIDDDQDFSRRILQVTNPDRFY